MKKKALLTVMACGLLAACGSKQSVVIHPVDEKIAMDVDFKPDGHYDIGILKPLTHAALDAAEHGFIERLNELGWIAGENVTYHLLNAAGTGSLLPQYADTLIQSCDLVLGIATDPAVNLKSAQLNAGTKKPILFTAVTNAVSTELVNTNEVPGGYVTGTSDAQPVDAQIQLIKECLPDAKKVGVIYTVSEQNSRLQALDAVKAIKDAGLTSEVLTCNDQNDISATAQALVDRGIDALYIPTDNNIAGHIQMITEICNPNHVLVCAGEEGMVKAGGHVSLSVDYTLLGARAGDIAAKILSGEKSPNQFPVTTMALEDLQYVKSSSHLASAGITLSPEAAAKDWVEVDE